MKSYVTMERHICPICGEAHDTGSLLLDKHLKERFDRYTITGVSPCPEHQKKIDEGLVFMLEIEPPNEDRSRLNPSQVTVTGRYATIRKEVAEEIFTDTKVEPISYVHPDVMEILIKMAG